MSDEMNVEIMPRRSYLPVGRYFIAHSYKDTSLRDELIACLPKGVEPYLFPPISVSPIEFASNMLIGALLVCDGVIYINGGHSLHSFWVAFEREYSLRPEIGFTPIHLAFQLSNHTRPLRLI